MATRVSYTVELKIKAIEMRLAEVPVSKWRIVPLRIHYHSKPIIHEDEWDTIAQNLEISLNYTLPASFEVFNELYVKHISCA